MLAGAMRGWADPAADPKNYDEQGQPSAVIQFFFQQVNLRFSYSGLIGAVQQTVCAVMVDSVTAQVAQLVNKPGGIVNAPVAVKAVPDVAAGDLLVAHAPPRPEAQVGNNKDGLVKLDEIGKVYGWDFPQRGRQAVSVER